MPSFYFEQVLQTALNGIDQNVTGPVLQVAGVILILSLLYAVYEAYSNGGDVRALGIAGIKYLILGLVFLNYQQAFRSVNSMFNTVADFIYNTNGIGDVIQNWLNSVSAYLGQQGLSSFWTLVTGAISGLLDVLLILVGLIILPVSYTLFTLAYAHVWIHPLSGRAFRTGSVAEPSDGAALANLLREPDDFSKLGSALCDFAGPDHRSADEQRKRRAGREWRSECIRWIQSDDSLGSG